MTNGEIENGLWYDDEMFRYWEGDHAERLYEDKPGGDYIEVAYTSSAAIKSVPNKYEIELSGSGSDYTAVVIHKLDEEVVAVVPRNRSYQAEKLTFSEVERIQGQYPR